MKITLSSSIIVLPLFTVGALAYLSSDVIHIAITSAALAAESTSMPDAIPDSQSLSASDKQQPAVFEKQPENGKKENVAQTAIVLSSWWERIVQSSNGSGGSVMYLLFGLSVVSLAFAFERIFHLSHRNIIPPPSVDSCYGSVEEGKLRWDFVSMQPEPEHFGKGDCRAS